MNTTLYFLLVAIVLLAPNMTTYARALLASVAFGVATMYALDFVYPALFK